MKARLREWRDAGDELHAPELQRYEAANALARAVATGQLPASEVTAAWEVITAVPVTLHRLEDGPEVVAMTQRLERKSAYDAAYLVLAIGSAPTSGRSTARWLATPARAGSGSTHPSVIVCGELSNARQTNRNGRTASRQHHRRRPALESGIATAVAVPERTDRHAAIGLITRRSRVRIPPPLSPERPATAGLSACARRCARPRCADASALRSARRYGGWLPTRPIVRRCTSFESSGRSWRQLPRTVMVCAGVDSHHGVRVLASGSDEILELPQRIVVLPR